MVPLMSPLMTSISRMKSKEATAEPDNVLMVLAHL